MKKTAHCIHHTHWDLIWYFTAQDATVQLCYNMKEMLEGFEAEELQISFSTDRVRRWMSTESFTRRTKHTYELS